MDKSLFEAISRSFGASRTRRGMLALLAGLAATAPGPRAEARSKKKRKRGRLSRGQVTAASVSASPLVTEGDSDAERMIVLAASDVVPLWDHTDLTLALHADGNVEPEYVATVRQAIAIWSGVLARHFAGLVTLTDVTDDHKRAVKADMRVHLKRDWAGVFLIGMAKCNGQKCQNLFVKSDWPESSWSRDLEYIVVSPELAGQVALHELGHALGLGHAQPLLTTDDIMGYGFLPWFHWPPREPVLSRCGLRALDTVFAWRVEGTAPRRPTDAQIVC
jgi:hypothetical protein